MAASISPFDSVSACLQSIIGAPVFSRRSFTCAAEIFIVIVPMIAVQTSLHDSTRAEARVAVTSVYGAPYLRVFRRYGFFNLTAGAIPLTRRLWFPIPALCA